VRWQSEWFGSFSLADVLRLTSRFTIAQFLAREDFNKRFAAEKPITLTEMLYPILQAYDSVAVQSDVEFGGQDQKFNLLVGRQLQEMVGQRPQQVFMTPLLVGTDGSYKMSKSFGNFIGVAEPPEQIFGKVMSIPDLLIVTYYDLVTDVPDEDIKEMDKAMQAGSVNPMELKKRLAKEIVIQLYDAGAAIEAEQHFVRTVQRKDTPDEIAECRLVIGWTLPQIMVESKVAKSISEAKRLITAGAVELDGVPVSSFTCALNPGSILKVGKRRFVRLTG
jgi:tyrosyl-tRNA synthetase